MANIDISRSKGRHKKRDVSVSAFEINGAEVAALIAAGTAANTDDFQLGVLPKNILITAVHTVVLESFDAALTVDLGFSGGTELDGAVALDGAADTVVVGNTGISIQTGPTVTADFSANPTQGRAMLIVQYIEYEQCTGELTNFVG